MKKFTMLSSVLASALMLTVASCSSEDVAGGDSQNGKGTTSFLAVNIENVGSVLLHLVVVMNRVRIIKVLMRMALRLRVQSTKCVSIFLMVMVLHICWLMMIQQIISLLTIWKKLL